MVCIDLGVVGSFIVLEVVFGVVIVVFGEMFELDVGSDVLFWILCIVVLDDMVLVDDLVFVFVWC